MEWHLLRYQSIKNILLGACLVLAGALTAPRACAQTAAGDLVIVQNTYIGFAIGSGATTSGSGTTATNDGGLLAVFTTPSNPTDANPNYLSNIFSYPDSRIWIRIDGGDQAANGMDVIFGDQTNGVWILPPTTTGSQLKATYEPFVLKNIFLNVQITLTVTLIHDTARFQITLSNTEQGATHTIGIAFVQNIVAEPDTGIADGPLRLPNSAYLHNETLLVGTQIPAYYETVESLAPATATMPAQVHTVRGIMRPVTSTETEPTPPTHFAYGNAQGTTTTTLANGIFELTDDLVDFPWLFIPNPSISFDNSANGPPNAAVALFWDPQTVLPGQSTNIITYAGAATTNVDLTPPLTLSVAGPDSLSYVQGTVQPYPGAPTTSTNDFTISAYVQNLTGLNGTTALSLGPVNLFLSLPPGLVLDTSIATNTATKTITSVGPGAEAAVSWQVYATGTATGTLNYSVTAAANVGSGKLVQRSISVPALPTETFASGLQLVSLPFNFSSASIASILPSNASKFTVQSWDSVTADYITPTTFLPGYGYWLNTNGSQSVTVALNNAIPLTTPTTSSTSSAAAQFSLTLPSGASPWYLIGDPYVYGINSGEIEVLNTQTLEEVNLATAADSQHAWIGPAIYDYDTTTGQYDIVDIGATIQPYAGYWMKVNLSTLQFIFPIVDSPGSSVSNAVKKGSRATSKPALTPTPAAINVPLGPVADNRWRLTIQARGQKTGDTAYIGVAPNATDSLDVYKYDKPPMLSAHVSLDITHSDWPNSHGARYAQDLRSPSLAQKTWNITLTSAQANENITLTWPSIAASVPRDYNLTLIDTTTNTRRALRSASSYVINTGKNTTRSIQIVATPSRQSGRLHITSFAILPNTSAASTRAVASVTIQYTLSQSADAVVTIRDAHGRMVRTLNTSTRAATQTGTAATDDTSGSALWDMRDQHGVSLSSGLYNIELDAVTTDGQKSRQVQPYLITR